MRRSSIILAILAVTLPVAWAYLSTTAFYEMARARGVYVCGVSVLGAVLLACFATSILSGVAVVLGTLAYRRLPFPRPLSRRFELAGLSLPLFVFGTYAAVILFARSLAIGGSLRLGKKMVLDDTISS
jgi:hypothetical protein